MKKLKEVLAKLTWIDAALWSVPGMVTMVFNLMGWA